MCYFYRQSANLKDIKQGVINQVASIVRLSVFLYSPLAFVLIMAALKRSVQEGKQPQHYYECPEWYCSTINECITIPHLTPRFRPWGFIQHLPTRALR